MSTTLTIRRALPADVGGLVAVLQIIARERIHSAIDRAWTVEEEENYLKSLSPREAIRVALDDVGTIVSIQVLDRWSSLLPSTAHVGQVGTFVLPEWRSRGVGHQLWSVTTDFARSAWYRKVVIQVRGSNIAAHAFYRQAKRQITLLHSSHLRRWGLAP